MMYPVWLHGTDGSVRHLLAGARTFHVMMYPEAIRHLEERFDIEIDYICTDTEDNIMWRRR